MLHTLLLVLCLTGLEEPKPSLVDAGQVKHVLTALVRAAEENHRAGPKALTGDALAEHYVRVAARSAKDPRAFLVGLGIGLDHTDLIRRNALANLYFGRLESQEERQHRLKVLGEPSLFGRRDWLLHYWGSAAATAWFNADVAERMGVAKEVLDAKTPGGSGFSFSDLHADFAGIALAKHLLADEAKGKERLAPLARRFEPGDYLPDLRLVEDSRSWEKFTQDFGGTDDERFTTYCKLIHHRTGYLAGLRTKANVPKPDYETRKEHDPNGIGKFYLGREIALVMGHQAAGWLERPEREQEEQPSKLVEALKLKPGLVVADIGAGSGYYSFRIAEKVGPKGKVLAVDIQPEMLALIRQRMKAKGVANIEPIRGTEKDPKLPPNSVDLILMVDVYHEFDFPFEMIETMLKALKPGGRFVFVEFRMEDENVPIKLVHKMSEQQVVKEMSVQPLGHKLRWAGTLDVLPWQHILFFEKRAADAVDEEPKKNEANAAPGFFEILVIDEATGRGVPLVELETIHRVRFVTDNAGRIAFLEPGLMGREVFFHVRGHGYSHAKDGFGFAGVRLTPRDGDKAVVRVKRQNVAERLYRLTGEGLYRDTVLLGHAPPMEQPVLNAGVVGQDSVQAVPYGGKLYWFWGDTSLARYPLGNFRTAGATSDLPGRGGLDPSRGVNYRYFADDKGYSRQMCPLDNEPGPVWIDGLLTVPDENGKERLVAHYARVKSLGEMLEHGLAVWNDEKQLFERAVKLDRSEKWRFPQGHPFRHREGDAEYVYSGNPLPLTRVRAELKAVLDPVAYEVRALADGQSFEDKLPLTWRREATPFTPQDEQKLLNADRLKPEAACYHPVDVETGKRISLHGGSVRWNAHRQRWILIGLQQGGTSFLGEVWYSEADSPTGPWPKARKIVTHDKYSFYNPVHHAFFDQEGGRIIYFEGTYSHTFSGNPLATPRYDYNQIMYRLDLDDARLLGVRK